MLITESEVRGRVRATKKEREKTNKIIISHSIITVHIYTVTEVIVYKYTILYPLM